MGIGITQFAAALQRANAHRGKGDVHNDELRWQIDATDELFRAPQYASLLVAYKNGAPVRMSDIGNVIESVEDVRNDGLENGKPTVICAVSRQPGANIIEAVDHIREVLPQLQASIPPSIHLSVSQDRTATIRASVHDVEYNLLISIALVILVVFIFLRNMWATIIPGIAVPLSLLGTFGALYFLEYPIDPLSLWAGTVSTGFFGDDEIFVIEKI